MNKAKLIDHLAEKLELTKADAGRMLEAVTTAISGSLTKGEDVSIAGFGTFAISARKAREARNPRTGEVVNVPAMNVPKFKAAKALKDMVR